MARIRTIKPELLEDEIAASLSDAAWRLFVSAWLLADDQGNLRAGTRYLAASVWQDTGRDALKPLIELAGKERVLVYEADGQRYANIPNWHRHQRVDNAGKPRVPEPPENVRELTRHFAASRGKFPRDAVSLGNSPLDPDPDPDHDHEHRTSGQDPAADQVREVWEQFLTQREKVKGSANPPKLTSKRRAQIKARLQEGFTVEQLNAATDALWGSSWHIEHGQTRPELVFRSAEQVEKLLERAGARQGGVRQLPKGPPPAPPPRNPEIQRRADELQLELADKSTEEKAALLRASLSGIGRPKRAAAGGGE